MIYIHLRGTQRATYISPEHGDCGLCIQEGGVSGKPGFPGKVVVQDCVLTIQEE